MTTHIPGAYQPHVAFTESTYAHHFDTEGDAREYADNAQDVSGNNLSVRVMPIALAESAPELLAALQTLAEAAESAIKDQKTDSAVVMARAVRNIARTAIERAQRAQKAVA